MEKTISLEWAKFSNYKNSTIIANSILALYSEDVILFYNLHTNDTSYYRACDEERGNGISCLCGHRIFQIFAIAEKCFESRILFMKYPDFEKFQILSDDNGTLGNYLDICFSETEILVALTGYPDYCLRIWNYRLGQLLCKTETNVRSQIQTINCSPFGPLTIAQKTSNLGLMNLWEMHVILDEALIINRPINLSIIERNFDIPYTFGQDGWLYFVDKSGNLYGMILSGVAPKLLYERQDYRFVLPEYCLSYYKSGCIIGDSYGEICLIKKIGQNDWSKMWDVAVDIPICKMFWIPNADKFYALNNFGSIMQIEEKDGTPQFKAINDAKEGYFIKYFDILNPDKKYAAVVANEQEDIVLLDVTDGKKVSKKKLYGNPV